MIEPPYKQGKFVYCPEGHTGGSLLPPDDRRAAYKPHELDGYFDRCWIGLWPEKYKELFWHEGNGSGVVGVIAQDDVIKAKARGWLERLPAWAQAIVVEKGVKQRPFIDSEKLHQYYYHDPLYSFLKRKVDQLYAFIISDDIAVKKKLEVMQAVNEVLDLKTDKQSLSDGLDISALILQSIQKKYYDSNDPFAAFLGDVKVVMGENYPLSTFKPTVIAGFFNTVSDYDNEIAWTGTSTSAHRTWLHEVGHTIDHAAEDAFDVYHSDKNPKWGKAVQQDFTRYRKNLSDSNSPIKRDRLYEGEEKTIGEHIDQSAYNEKSHAKEAITEMLRHFLMLSEKYTEPEALRILCKEYPHMGQVFQEEMLPKFKEIGQELLVDRQWFIELTLKELKKVSKRMGQPFDAKSARQALETQTTGQIEGVLEDCSNAESYEMLHKTMEARQTRFDELYYGKELSPYGAPEQKPEPKNPVLYAILSEREDKLAIQALEGMQKFHKLCDRDFVGYDTDDITPYQREIVSRRFTKFDQWHPFSTNHPLFKEVDAFSAGNQLRTLYKELCLHPGADRAAIRDTMLRAIHEGYDVRSLTAKKLKPWLDERIHQSHGFDTDDITTHLGATALASEMDLDIHPPAKSQGRG